MSTLEEMTYMLRPTWMFMDSMIGPINVHSTYKLKIVSKALLKNTHLSMFF